MAKGYILIRGKIWRKIQRNFTENAKKITSEIGNKKMITSEIGNNKCWMPKTYLKELDVQHSCLSNIEYNGNFKQNSPMHMACGPSLCQKHCQLGMYA